jgi:predicted nucleic-acid-binding protein
VKCKGTLDTNTILRYFVQDNEEQAGIVEELFKSARKEGRYFYIPLTVILELVFVLHKTYRIEKETVANIIRSLKTIPAEIEKEGIVFGALELFLKGMKFSDAIIYMQAIQEGTTPVYTFDREDLKGKPHTVLLG